MFKVSALEKLEDAEAKPESVFLQQQDDHFPELGEMLQSAQYIHFYSLKKF